MRYDNEEAWLKACFIASGTAPVEISNIIDLRDRYRYAYGEMVDFYDQRQKDDLKRQAVSVAINLLRGALIIHRRATEEGTTAPFDSLLAFRLEQAAKELPEGWKVVVTAERGAVRTDLYNDADERQPVREAEDPSEGVWAALQFASAIRPATPPASPSTGETS